MADVFSGPHWVSFLFQDQTGRWPLPASKHNNESSIQRLFYRPQQMMCRHWVGFDLFLRLFSLLFLCFLLARSGRAVLLAKDVAVLVVIGEQVNRFLGFDFLLFSYKTGESKQCCEGVMILPGLERLGRNSHTLTGLFQTFTAEEVIILLIFKQTTSTSSTSPSSCRDLSWGRWCSILFAPHWIRVVPCAEQVVICRAESIWLVEENAGEKYRLSSN